MSEFKEVGNFIMKSDGNFEPFDMSKNDDALVIEMPRDISFVISFDADGTYKIDEVSE
ncbi:hypothetical protein AAIB41_02520 [Brucella sp. BE17]|uniref:hypothetical protein n=1 Tax=Brucella sp. BE17 TaxID=3142977 RepID=UPI0031BA242D